MSVEAGRIYRCPRCEGLLDVAHDVGALRDRSAAAWMKLFDDRWIQSAKWTGSRTGVTGIENFAQASASLGTARTLSYKSSLLLDSDMLGGAKHRITGLAENRREHF
ncbi:MAG: hypothetical protein ABR562_10170, partial [Thermoplasmatota archaeon]